jgi:futalosine hydrolase
VTVLLGFSRVLVVTAVDAERDRVLAGLCLPPGDPSIVSVGVGPAAAAATTARLLATASTSFDAVLCAGIAGGIAGRTAIGGVAVATACVAADLGAESPDGFLGLDELGFGTARCPVDETLVDRLRTALPDAVAGEIVSVSTVTGTAASTDALLQRHPDAVAEAMEGFGVGTAVALWPGVAFGELRTVSNLVGPRDRGSWRIPAALDALRDAFAALRQHDHRGR